MPTLTLVAPYQTPAQRAEFHRTVESLREMSWVQSVEVQGEGRYTRGAILSYTEPDDMFVYLPAAVLGWLSRPPQVPNGAMVRLPSSPHFEGDASVANALLESQEGRERLAQSMMAPLRRRLEYSGLARAAFQVEQIPAGAAPTYGTGGSGIVDSVQNSIATVGQGRIATVGQGRVVGTTIPDNHPLEPNQMVALNFNYTVNERDAIVPSTHWPSAFDDHVDAIALRTEFSAQPVRIQEEPVSSRYEREVRV